MSIPAVQVNWKPPRPLNRYEREVIERTMEQAAWAQFAKWNGHDVNRIAVRDRREAE